MILSSGVETEEFYNNQKVLGQSEPIIDWPGERNHTKYLFNPRVIPFGIGNTLLWKQPILDLV